MITKRGGSNSHIVKLNNAHKAAVVRAKLDRFRIYDLRHTFATRAAEAGVDLVTLATLLGHTRVQMLMRYAHPTDAHKVIAIERIEELRLLKQAS